MTRVTAGHSVRCSAWARAEGLDPIGSAGSYNGFLVVDLPLPWPRDVADASEIAGLIPLAQERRLRIQATVPRDSSRRMVLYRREPNAPFAGFSRHGAFAGGDPVATLLSLLDRSDGGDTTRQVLICTHGRRDVCCGSGGTQLALEMDRLDLPAGVLVSRTSHTGGHRFAPTLLVLPEANAWAFASSDLVRQVLYRDGDVHSVLGHYRGCAGLGSPQAQVLERYVFGQLGWGLLSRPRSGSIVASDETGAVVRLEVAGAEGGSPTVWEGAVRSGRSVPVPPCGRPIWPRGR